jgi:hypothetical protein
MPQYDNGRGGRFRLLPEWNKGQVYSQQYSPVRVQLTGAAAGFSSMMQRVVRDPEKKAGAA